MNLRRILMSLINYQYMIGFRANNRLRVIGTFCNFHVHSKKDKQMRFGFKQPLVGRIVA